MPTYVYRREDGTTFEVDQRITEDALEVCPSTGQRVTRVISGGTGLIFKGSGFYVTDYVRNQNGAGAAKKASSNGSTQAAERKSPDAEADAKAASDGKAKSAGDSAKSD